MSCGVEGEDVEDSGVEGLSVGGVGEEAVSRGIRIGG